MIVSILELRKRDVAEEQFCAKINGVVRQIEQTSHFCQAALK